MVRVSEPPPPDRSGPTPAELMKNLRRECEANVEYDRLRNAVTDAAEYWDENYPWGHGVQELRTAVRALQEWRKRQ